MVPMVLAVSEGRGQARVLAGPCGARVWLLGVLGRVLGSRLGLGPRLGSRRALALATLSGRGLDRRAVDQLLSMAQAWPSRSRELRAWPAPRSSSVGVLGVSPAGRERSLTACLRRTSLFKPSPACDSFAPASREPASVTPRALALSDVTTWSAP
jgi:hypothetical protein